MQASELMPGQFFDYLGMVCLCDGKCGELSRFSYWENGEIAMRLIGPQCQVSALPYKTWDEALGRKLTLQWCLDNLQGYETREDANAIEFVVAKCTNGSDAIVAFNRWEKSKDKPRVFVSNFYVEHVQTIDDLMKLVCALGFGDNAPWSVGD